MKQALITLSFIATIFSCSFGQVSKDSIHKLFLKEFEIPERNYIVDKFEHSIFIDIDGFAPAYIASTGYDFVYNFHEKFRLIAGIGLGVGYKSQSILSRATIQFGKKLTRLELGIHGHASWYRQEEHYAGLGAQLGLKFRHFRNIEAGLSWSPYLHLNYGGGDLLNFKLQLRVFINSSKRRKELGLWKGVHPREYKLSPKFALYKRKYKKGLKK